MYQRTPRIVDPATENNPSSCSTMYPAFNMCEEVDAEIEKRFEDLVPRTEENCWKRIFKTYMQRGFCHAINEAQLSNSPFLNGIANFFTKLYQLYERFCNFFYKEPKIDEIELTASIVTVNDWLKSYVRFLLWHPKFHFTLAIAGNDDVVRIYKEGQWIKPVLKDPRQEYITDIAWRPYTHTDLAIATKNGICFWYLKSDCAHSTYELLFLKHCGHEPVMSIQWSTDGTHLASASFNNLSIVVWNIDTGEKMLLPCFTSFCSIIKWSPASTYLLCGTLSKHLVILRNDGGWRIHQELLMSDRIQTACWSPCENFLIYCCNNDCKLHCLQFFNEFCTGQRECQQIFDLIDLSECVVGDTFVKRKVRNIIWDPSGKFLAVTFKDANYVLILFSFLNKFAIKLVQATYILGMEDETPAIVSFQSIEEKGDHPVLTIGWNTGRIEFKELIA